MGRDYTSAGRRDRGVAAGCCRSATGPRPSAAQDDNHAQLRGRRLEGRQATATRDIGTVDQAIDESSLGRYQTTGGQNVRRSARRFDLPVLEQAVQGLQGVVARRPQRLSSSQS